MNNTYTLRVTAEVTVDERAWTTAYGNTDRNVVVDVEDYLLSLIDQSAAASEGAIQCTGLAVHEAASREGP